MKKLSTYIWLTALLTLPVLSSARPSDFSLSFYNSLKQRRFEQSARYTVTPFPDWKMQIMGRSSEDKRIDFDQFSQNSNLNISLVNNGALLQHRFQSGYEYLYDFSDLESALKPYQNKTGFLGYGAVYTPFDSLRLEASLRAFYRQEQDRFVADNKLISQGLHEQLNAGYGVFNSAFSLHVNGNYEQKRLDWEKFRQLSANLLGSYAKDALAIDCLVTASTRDENLFVLSRPDPPARSSRYVKHDEQKRKNLNVALNLNLPLGDYLTCRISETYSVADHRNKINASRNNRDFNNTASLEFNYRLTDEIKLHSVNRHDYQIKDLSHIDNTRITDVRSAKLGGSWEYSAYDSLLFDYTIELRRTEHPDDEHLLDNDYLSNIYNLGWIVYWKDRIRIANHLLYLERDEIFVDALLSANNNTVRGLQWQPECDVLFGDSFMLRQAYQIRADYDDYHFDKFSTDTFYRQISAAYHIIYDSTPLAAKVDLPKWNLLPHRPRTDNALRIDLGYTWERSEAGSEEEEDVYYISGVYDRQTVSLLAQKQVGIVICQLHPKYSWGSWEEYNLLVSAALQLNQNSVMEIRLNPVGSEITDLDWRLSCSLGLMF